MFACVPNPGKQSIWRQCPRSATKQSTKKLPNRPGFTHVQPVTLKPVIRIFRIFRVFVSAFSAFSAFSLAHQNRTIAIASDFRVDGAKSPEIPQQEGLWGSEIAARNRRSLATFHCTLKSQCIIAVSCFGNRAISGVRDGHRNRKSLQFR